MVTNRKAVERMAKAIEGRERRAVPQFMEIVERIGNKWSILVIGALGDGAMRFCQLKARIEGISQKMLTQTVRGLERDGLVSRQVVATYPPQVTYSLSRLGKSLLTKVEGLSTWVWGHIDEVESSRRRFDSRSGL